jgi:hypothetical protein
MYIVLEYVAYVGIVGMLGALLFGPSATVLITREGAKQVALTSRRLADRARQTVERYRAALPMLPRHNSHESQ